MSLPQAILLFPQRINARLPAAVRDSPPTSLFSFLSVRRPRSPLTTAALTPYNSSWRCSTRR